MTLAPFAPWTLGGEMLAGLLRVRRPMTPLPMGLRRLPGPALVVAVRYTTSPVGPYLELAIGEPAHLGARPGWCITTMVVDSPASRMGGRLNWGFPKELGSLVWETDGVERRMRWADRGIEVCGRAAGVRLPILVPVRSLQRRGDGPVVVPGWLRGLGHLTRLEVTVPDGDPLAPLAGRHVGAHVSSMRFRVAAARRPVGITSTLRAPLRAPEPAITMVEG